MGAERVKPQDNTTEVLKRIGRNDADNAFNSASVTANRDGSELERSEFVMDELQKAGMLAFRGTCDVGMTASLTTIVCNDLKDFGNDFFNEKFYVQILKNASGVGTAPELQVRKVTDYVSASGTFTVDAFTANVEESDEIGVIHESLITLGRGDSNNVFDSSSVTSNEDGSIFERLEWIQTALGGTAMQLRTQQSESTTVEEGAYMQFSISLLDMDTGAIASALIDTTAMTVSVAKSTGGAGFSTSGLTIPTFTKADGLVTSAYQFEIAQWQVGDVYKLDVSGVTVTIAGDIAYVPQVEWSNMVVEELNLHNEVAAIQADIGDPSVRTNMKSLELMIGVPDSVGQTMYSALAGGAGVVAFPGAANIGDGVSLAEAIRAILTSMVGGDDYDNYTNISNSANASLDAIAQKFATTVGINAANTFSTTITGVSQTTVEAAFDAIATYVAASGAAFSKKVNNLTLRTNLEDIIQDICAVIGCDAANAWGTTINGVSQTTVGGTEQAIGTAVQNLAALTDGTSVSLDTVVDKSIICKLATKDAAGGDSSDYDNTTDSLEALSDKVGAFTGNGGVTQPDSAKASLDLLHTDVEDIHADLILAAITITTILADTALIKADVGDASASTLLSLYGILGNPTTSLNTQIGEIHDDLATVATSITVIDTVIDLIKIDTTEIITDLDLVAITITAISADAILLKADVGDASSATLLSLYGILGNPSVDFATQIDDIHDDLVIAAITVTAILADTILLKADIGDASAATLGSLYGILGNPTNSLNTQIGDIHDDLIIAAITITTIYSGMSGLDNTINRAVGKKQISEFSLTSAANAGLVTITTVTTQPCLIESVIIHADTATTADMTNVGIYGGDNNVVTFLSTVTTVQSSLDVADEQVAWTGAVRLGTGKPITANLIGTGPTVVDFTVNISYRACVNGGYLA